MTGRRLFPIVFALFFCASPMLVGAANTSENPHIVKYNADENPLRQKSQEALRTVRLVENYDFYDIEGSSIAELKQQMKQGGTKWSDGKVYAALTTWDIRYHYETVEKAGKFSLKSIVTDISVVYHLPNWTTVAVAAPELAGQWELYMEHLREHEYGHKDISVKAAEEINQALAELGSFSSKEQLEKEAKRLANAKFTRLKELQIAYDDETDHGIQQGALLVAADPALASFLPGR